MKDLAVKTHINQLQKQVKEELKVESLVSSEKFCNSVSLGSNPNESCHKIKNFLKPKGQRLSSSPPCEQSRQNQC